MPARFRHTAVAVPGGREAARPRSGPVKVAAQRPVRVSGPVEGAAQRPVRVSGPVEGAWGNREVPPAVARGAPEPGGSPSGSPRRTGTEGSPGGRDDSDEERHGRS